MQPINPLDLPMDPERDYSDQKRPGSPWPAIAAVLLVLVLLIGAVQLVGSDDGNVLVPTTEAPLRGSGGA